MCTKRSPSEKAPLTDYEIAILEELSSGIKNIYQICKGIGKKNGKLSVYYATVLRAVKRLDTLGFIQECGTGIRESKEYEILVKGLTALYIIQGRESNRLEYHRSQMGQDIIEKIANYVSKKLDFPKNKENNLFFRTLQASPSSIEFFYDYGETALIPESITDLDINKKLYNSLVKFFPIHGLVLTATARYPVTLLKKFYRTRFPLIFISKDFKRYQNDEALRSIFVDEMNQDRIREGEAMETYIQETFENILKQIKSKSLDTTKPISDLTDEYLERYLIENPEDCWKYWYIFIPPIGDPELACTGTCPYSDRIIYQKDTKENSVKK